MDELTCHMESNHWQPIPADASDTTDTEERPRKRPCETTVSIATSSNAIITFSTAVYAYEPNMPKFPQEVIDTLWPIVSINAPGTQQSSLNSLKTFKHVHGFVVAALDQDLEGLPGWLWTHQAPHGLAAQEKKLLNAVKFILTNFADNCGAVSMNAPAVTDYERTWWVRRVVPIFQTFGNQTGCLMFDWCEVETKHHAFAQMDPKLWEKGQARFADGLGYDWYGEERLIMEGSCGQHKEKVSKTVDDSVKQISSMIAMLKGMASSHRNASFATMLKTKVFGLQSIKTTLVLSEVQFTEQGKFTYNQLRTAEIPTSYMQRSKWLRVFEQLYYRSSSYWNRDTEVL
ncbi:hypothetical protein DFQ28_003703 [Apophysomyces sp. BC1034]|nr:hypothetical protein DFQ30_004452 [Apophysomyces sp. BC1015]KAG0163459.1 hypothetical protein DFQ29_003074 [Apophysomyces sp. BC1021]KAG0178700.1 hypothetical protein DFQ28_003703 [Apophysomyces sp. BC1034]